MMAAANFVAAVIPDLTRQRHERRLHQFANPDLGPYLDRHQIGDQVLVPGLQGIGFQRHGVVADSPSPSAAS